MNKLFFIFEKSILTNIVMPKICFNKNYFLLFILLFVTEVLIALYVHDDFIRPFFGDFLVVILIYTFGMSWIYCSKFKMALTVLILAFCIEFGQYFDWVHRLGLQDSKLANVVLGNSFAVADLVAYVAGFGFILLVEYWIESKK